MKCFLFVLLGTMLTYHTTAQVAMPPPPPIPYHEMPDPPATYTAGTVAARIIDGLGYRYYWATDGINDAVLDYEPGNEGRKTADVLEHIHGLTLRVFNATRGQVNEGDDPTFRNVEQLRAATLWNLYRASQQLRKATDEEVAAMQLIFKRGERESVFPFWNVLNGPLNDAITHVGQIVSYRRSAGLPQNPKVNVFSGKNRQ